MQWQMILFLFTFTLFCLKKNAYASQLPKTETKQSSSLLLSQNKSIYRRPTIIEDAVKNNDIVYYFGIGSNMLKSKVINRGLNGSKINIIDFQPGFVRNYRVAFNVPGFPPLEPAMAGIEPVQDMQSTHQVISSGISHQILDQSIDECHGSLITLTAQEYHKLWLSEGGGRELPGYQEILVDVIPYQQHDAFNSSLLTNSIYYTKPANSTADLVLNAFSSVSASTEGKEVKAIALRAADHIRLQRDRDPSQRYMNLLIQG